MIFPMATAKGGISVCFPDVCKIPAPPAPFVPAPYPNPNLGNVTNEVAAQKTKLATKTTTTIMSKAASAHGALLQRTLSSMGRVSYQPPATKTMNIRNKMSIAHQQLMAYNGSESPEIWQQALENYVLAASAVYLMLNES
jgi:hypothetical protein